MNLMRDKIGAFDWSKTPLGFQSSWVPTLCVLVELMLNSSQPMFIVWGPERLWLYNDAIIPILRDKHPSALGQSAENILPEAWSDLRPLYDRVFTGEAISKLGFQIPLHRQGVIEAADFDFSFTPIRVDPNSPVLGLFGACAETTSHLATRRQQLAMAQRESSRILEMSRDLFAVASFEGRLLSVNPAWSHQLGYTDAELLTRPFAEIIHPDDLEATDKVVKVLMSGHPAHQFEVRLRKKDGSFIVYAWSSVPELDPPNGTFYTVGRDINEERAAQMELQTAQESLRQAYKMEAVGQLTGGLAHDFNNLLAGVSTSLQIMRMRLATGKFDGFERYVQLGMNSVDRAAALTQRLLAFSRRQTLDPKPVDVNGLIQGFEDLIRRTIGPAIDLQTVPDTDAWNIRVDALQLENSLLNLCINARDAMPDGGRLMIATSNQTVDGLEARRLKLQPGDYVRICVDDTGNGMDAKTKARVFDPFFTTKPIGQGTGLGLSMVHGFVQQSGGQVHIDTQVGRGTRLCLYMPRYLGEARPGEATHAPDARSFGQGEKVVVVEDEATIRSLLTEVLQEAGYEVTSAEDGAAGMRLLATSGPLDLLVTDVGLPGGMNGRQVADAARVLQPGLKVLFITGYADKAAIGDGDLPPGMEVMTKPFEVVTLTKKLRELLGREPVNPAE